jgi:hypothetical protein
MSTVQTANGEIFPDVATARWSMFFDRTAGRQNREWHAAGKDGLPPGFVVKYDGSAPLYAVPRDFADLTPDEWKALLAAESAEAVPRYSVVILDGMPGLRMFWPPSRVFENAGGCWKCSLTPAQKAEAHDYKISREVYATAAAYDRDGLALWSYKERPWWDDYCNFFGRDDDNDIAEISTHLSAIDAAMSMPLRVVEKAA